VPADAFCFNLPLQVYAHLSENWCGDSGMQDRSQHNTSNPLTSWADLCLGIDLSRLACVVLYAAGVDRHMSTNKSAATSRWCMGTVGSLLLSTTDVHRIDCVVSMSCQLSHRKTGVRLQRLFLLSVISPIRHSHNHRHSKHELTERINVE
jgi:hypothetical protein